MDARFDDDPLLAEYRGKRRYVINEKMKRCRQFKDMVNKSERGQHLTYRENTPKE